MPRVRDGTLVGLDGLDVDGLVVPLREGVRPPGGVAARVDWRLGGRLSRLVLDRKLTGEARELAMLDSGDALGAARVFVVGVGDGESELAASLESAVRAVVGAGARRVAFAPLDGVPADEGARAWARAVAAADVELDSWMVLDPDGTLFRSSEAVAAAAARLGG